MRLDKAGDQATTFLQAPDAVEAGSFLHQRKELLVAQSRLADDALDDGRGQIEAPRAKRTSARLRYDRFDSDPSYEDQSYENKT